MSRKMRENLIKLRIHSKTEFELVDYRAKFERRRRISADCNLTKRHENRDKYTFQAPRVT